MKCLFMALIGAVLFSCAPVFAETIIKNNGEYVGAPRGYRAVLVPQGTPRDQLAIGRGTVYCEE